MMSLLGDCHGEKRSDEIQRMKKLKKMTQRLLHSFAVCALVAILLSSCEGVFGIIYDEIPEGQTFTGSQTIVEGESGKSVEGEIYVDASSWNSWSYIVEP